ncbi:MAG: DUF58 domain-containing protein [Methylococcaceae bacterium]|nr:DUF58 domain-containing protein [Methylococcaceae bacterium]
MSPSLKIPAAKPIKFRRKRIFDSIFKGEKPVKGPITLQHRRIFILPTQQGMSFILLLVILLLIAFIYNNNLTYLLGFMLLSILMVSILLTFRSLAGLVIATGHTKPVFAGEVTAINLLLDNPSPADRFNLEFKVEQPTHCDVPAYSSESLTLYATTRKRGWFQVGTIRVTSRFPLGLFRAWSPIRFDHPMLVYPKPASLLLAFPEISSQQNPQGFSRQGGGDDFYGLKTYQAGDGIKQIHWKAYAKGQGLLTKQFSDDKAAEIWLNYAATPGHDTEERLSQLCRWVLDAEAAGLKYGFQLPGTTLPPAQGAAHYAQCLQALALF